MRLKSVIIVTLSTATGLHLAGRTIYDLILAIIRADFGQETAIAVSELLIFNTERSESTPQKERVPAMFESKMPRGQILKLMERNIEIPLSVTQIASQTGISQRQREGNFKENTNTTVSHYYPRVKVASLETAD